VSYPAQEKAWVRRILARLNPEQRARYEEECKEAPRHYRSGRLYDTARAEIAERILWPTPGLSFPSKSAWRWQLTPGRVCLPPLCHEALNEIGKLEAELEEYREIALP